MISVSLPDGSERELAEGSSGADLAAAIGPRLAADAVVAVVDGAENDLAAPLPDGSSVEIVTASSSRGLHTIRHSTAHVLAQAVLDLYPGATFAIGPPIEHGFYYDFELSDRGTFTDADLERIEARMREIIAADQSFERMEMDAADALELFAAHPYKRAIIEAVALGAGADGDLASEAASDGTVSCYRNDAGNGDSDGFVDLCLGPHVPSTGRLGHFALQG